MEFILAPNFGMTAPLPLLITPGQLLDVVHHAVQVPLRVDLPAPAQVQAPKPLVVPDVAKHRLHRADALAVAPPSLGTVDSLLHRMEHVVGTALVLLEDRHLPHRRALWVAQAQVPLIARAAAALAALLAWMLAHGN